MMMENKLMCEESVAVLSGVMWCGLLLLLLCS